YTGLPQRALVFPALFDNVVNRLHRKSKDRLGTVLMIQNPTPYRSTVRAIARDEGGRVLTKNDIFVDPNKSIEISSIDGSRNGLVFGPETAGSRFTLELVPNERIYASALVMRYSDD